MISVPTVTYFLFLMTLAVYKATGNDDFKQRRVYPVFLVDGVLVPDETVKKGTSNIRTLEKHPSPFPKCDCCGIQLPLWRLNSRHYKSEK